MYMKSLKSILEASVLADIDYQLEYGDEALKNNIIDWIKDNVMSIKENKLNFDFNTAPITVNYDTDIQFKYDITSLTNGMFQWGEVGGYFSCEYCNSLKSLEGAPKIVKGYVYAFNCKLLQTLEGAPEKVGKDFSCRGCKSLKSLKGAPKEVGGYFNCERCPSLKSLRDAPKEVGDDFECYECGTQFTEEDVKKVSNVKGKIRC